MPMAEENFADSHSERAFVARVGLAVDFVVVVVQEQGRNSNCKTVESVE